MRGVIVKPTVEIIAKKAEKLAQESTNLAKQLNEVAVTKLDCVHGVDPLIYGITIFVLACFIGYYVIWKVTPALHTPLMSVTNAISGIIIVGAIIAVGPEEFGISQFVGFIAIVIASINIVGGFLVTQRMLEMFKKK